jgi:TPR repeat protein
MVARPEWGQLRPFPAVGANVRFSQERTFSATGRNDRVSSADVPRGHVENSIAMETMKKLLPLKGLATAIGVLVILAGHSTGPVSAATGFSIFTAPIADAKDQTPRDVPRRAAEALALAKKWQSDAILIEVRTRQSMDYALDFGFRSPSTRSRFSASYAKGRMTSQVFPPVSNSSDGDPIPLQFIDLPAALAAAQKQGMNAPIKEAWLDVSRSGQGLVLTWQIQADTDHYPYLFKVSAAPGGALANTGGLAFGVPPSSTGIGAPPSAPPQNNAVRVVTPTPAAEALWQRGNAYYDRNDFRNALPVYMEAAKLGHPRALAVLGNMYREGEGVTKDLGQAVAWYTKAADAGHRGAQFSLGSMYEEGEGVPKNVAKAAQLYEMSARQGMPEAQFALGLSYEFGQGVQRNRRTAIYWLDQVAAQGDGRARWYSDWLRRPDTPQFKSEVEFGQYTANKVAEKVYSEMHAGDRVFSAGNDQQTRNERAAAAERAGDNNRASSCRGGGPC